MRELLPHGGHHLFDRVVARRLQRFYSRLAGRRPEAGIIVDLGCGPGHLAAALAQTHPEAKVIGIDLDPVQLRIAKRHHGELIDLRLGASHALELPDDSVDWVLATETYHHWSRQDDSLAEIHRVLKPGGEAWIIEGAGDMTKQEMVAWSGMRPWPGLLWIMRQVFRRHGYLPADLQTELLDRAEASPFGGGDVEREDGWFLVKLRR